LEPLNGSSFGLTELVGKRSALAPFRIFGHIWYLEYLETAMTSPMEFTVRPDDGGDRVKSILARRMAHLLETAFQEASPAELVSAASADTNLGVGIALLGALARSEAFRALEPLAAARLRGVEAKRQLMERAGGLLSAAEVGTRLGIGTDAVAKRRQADRLLALPRGDRGFDYPACQFSAHGVVPGLERLLAATSGLEPWVRLDLFTSRQDELGGRTPLQAALDGATDDAVAAVSVMTTEHV
jgi:hypothetical protein